MKTQKTSFFSMITAVVLCLLIAFGIGCRFYNMDWDSEALLHPDEYGLTNTLTRLRVPASFSEYFNTRISPLSPYNKYDINGADIENGPDNTMRWGQLPMILIRVCAEATGNTGYTELRRMGRYLVAFMDVGSLFLLYWIGKRLFDRRTALLAAALCSLAVMPIQQSHFMTVDQFAVFFTMLTLAAAVRIAQETVLARNEDGVYTLTRHGFGLIALFGLFLGMAIACKVNLAVLGLVLAPAMLISVGELRLAHKEDFSRLITLILLCVLIAIIGMALSVRVFQPMSFRAETGDTGFFTFAFNPDWLRSMGVAASESKGIGGGPPSEQWAHRPAVLFALVNMVFYGMGLPLGIGVCVCSLFAWIAIFKKGSRSFGTWKRLLIPAFWGSFFFLFMSTRFVKNNRYFLPAYPMLCLTTAWALRRAISSQKAARRTFGALSCALILAGSAFWAYTFTKTVYGQPHSRVEAVNWMYENIPGVIHLSGTDPESGEYRGVPVPGAENLVIFSDTPFTVQFTPYQSIDLAELILPHVSTAKGTSETVTLQISLSDNASEKESPVTEASAAVSTDEKELRIPLKAQRLEAGQDYLLTITLSSSENLLLRRTVLANENWDEGLPFRLHGMDPFGQMYKGITNEVRWWDSEEKRQMLIDTMTQADYLILPSQRAIWSVCRIPKTYPMTMGYYEALFAEELGFQLEASFQRPFKFGPLTLSDLAGTLTQEEVPTLPVNNRSFWAAEEAFSIYDHPPVWIFKKTADFDPEQVKAFLDQYDLSQVVIQGPTDAEW